MNRYGEESVKFMGVTIDVLKKVQLDSLVMRMFFSGDRPQIMVCANPHSLAESKADPAFRKALGSAHLVVADGAGVCLLAKILKNLEVERITGADFFKATMEQLNRNKGRVFFFGSSQNVLDKIKAKVEKEYADIVWAGMISPPFGNWDERLDIEFVEAINLAQPDVLWVGMTAPKQELWVDKNRHRLDIQIVASIGAVFDFYAGTYNRAPEWARKRNLEWAYRLFKEPRRMWKRNFVSTPLFIKEVLIEHFRGS